MLKMLNKFNAINQVSPNRNLIERAAQKCSGMKGG
jgi:hypothetical protein